MTQEELRKEFDQLFTVIVTYEKYPDENEPQRLKEPVYRFTDFPNTNPKTLFNWFYSKLTQSKEEARKEERERIAKMIKKNYYCSYKKDLDKLSQYGKGSREGINSVVLEICASLTKTEGD